MWKIVVGSRVYQKIADIQGFDYMILIPKEAVRD